MSMLGYADEMVEDIPFFTPEERKRIDRVYRHYRDKYGHKIHFGTIPLLKKQVEVDLDVKEKQLMRAAGWK